VRLADASLKLNIFLAPFLGYFRNFGDVDRKGAQH
jgi:hypothetical protein